MIAWPGVVTVEREGDFVNVSAGLWVTPTVAPDGGDVIVVPSGVWALAVAVFATLPLSMSAWVTV